MNKYIIVAESGADLSQETIETYDIRVAQMHVEIDGRDYLDNDVSIDELTGFYDRTGNVPKTSGVNPQQYEAIFAKIKEEYPDAIVLHLCYSAVLSIGYQSSIQADDDAMRIYRVDIKNVSIGHGLVVTKAAELIAQNPDIEPEDLVARVEAIVQKTRFSFIPGNLAYLRAGGRVSNAQYIGATLLKLNPLIEVIDGFMLSTKKYRGTGAKVFRKMLADYLKKYAIDRERVYLVHACALDNVIKEAVERFLREAGVKSMVWHAAGGVISSHSGPGGVGIAGIEA